MNSLHDIPWKPPITTQTSSSNCFSFTQQAPAPSNRYFLFLSSVYWSCYCLHLESSFPKYIHLDNASVSFKSLYEFHFQAWLAFSALCCNLHPAFLSLHSWAPFCFPFSFVHSTYLFSCAYFIVSYVFVFCLPTEKWQEVLFCLFSSLIYSKNLSKCLKHSRLSTIICWGQFWSKNIQSKLDNCVSFHVVILKRSSK